MDISFLSEYMIPVIVGHLPVRGLDCQAVD